jgi:hypothetical protein
MQFIKNYSHYIIGVILLIASFVLIELFFRSMNEAQLETLHPKMPDAYITKLGDIIEGKAKYNVWKIHNISITCVAVMQPSVTTPTISCIKDF